MFFFLHLLCVWGYTHVYVYILCKDTCVEVRRQLAGVGSLLLLGSELHLSGLVPVSLPTWLPGSGSVLFVLSFELGSAMYH